MSHAAITLRLANARDAHAIALLSRDTIEQGLPWKYDPARVQRAMRQRDTTVLAACDRGSLVGFAMMEFGDERAHLVLLAVRPTHRRQGIARRIVEWLLESARTAGIASVHLELRARNDAARRFYRTLSFSETILIPRYYGGNEGALRMIRMLRQSPQAAYVWQPPSFDRR